MASGLGSRPGDLIADRYRIERELGQGGMAIVYLVHDTKYDRRVALKLLRREIALLLGGDRFLREIELVARLNHPNILPLHESDQVAERLFFLMPYVEGGSLRDRLAREPRLTVDEAVDITRQAAAGLSYAHRLGVIHRDIKPANLLLSGNHLFIADFGIARAVRQAATEESLTEAGHVLGTPAYMAPEQIRGASQVDGRADEYSLACVLFEMLAGRTPGTDSHKPGVVKAALKAAHRQVPPAVELALGRALALDPDHRFATAEAFAAELEAPGPGLVHEIVRAVRRAGRRSVIGTAALALGVAGLLWWRQGHERGANQAAAADTTRYAILPFEYGAGVAPGLDEEQGLRAALRRWKGIEPVDPVRVREEVARRGGGRLTGEDAVAISRVVEAGRYLRGTISQVGDSLRIAGTLYSVQGSADSMLAEHTVSLVPDPVRVEAALAELVDHLLLRRAPPAGGFGALGTHSLPAWQAFSAGQQAIREWRLAAADSAFDRAAGFDGQYARASLWLAVVRTWKGDEPARWRYAAENAASRKELLDPSEAAMAEALRATAAGRLDQACPQWRALTLRAPDDFAAWYGTAQCETSDGAVLRDPRSPSSWRFRTSYHSALNAYRRAFELLPSLLEAFRGDAYESARRLLFTRGTKRRVGKALPPDTTTFGAEPAWDGDSLAMVPYPAATRVDPKRWQVSSSRVEAVRHQRQLFRDLTLTWVTAFPRSSDAREALALALEMLGDPAALDTIRGARGLATDDASRARVIGTEIWMQVRLALPGRPEALRSARALADSLIERYGTRRDPPEPSLLASLAMLIGRPAVSARLLRRAALVEGWDVAGGLAIPGVALLAFAAAGGPADSLKGLEVEVGTAIDRVVPPAGRADSRLEWLGRAATLAWPEVTLGSLKALCGSGDYLVNAICAWSAGDTGRALAPLQLVERGRRRIDPADLTFDTLLPEACLLSALGQDSVAIAWLDPTLTVVGEVTAPGSQLSIHAGSLVRTMALRAELASRTGDRPTARRWAQAVVALWEKGDRTVQPLIERMRPLVN
jgi:tRNA A-37 threonylcarbamoyl transferase component Bud32/tetratricopeptide (TPR) repeat protein